MINIEQDFENINVSVFNENGDVEIVKIPIDKKDRFNWVDSSGKSEIGIRTWDGKKVRKQKTQFLSSRRIMEIMEKQPEYVKNKIYSHHDPKKFFLDIETEIIDGFPDSTLAKEKIQLIQFAHNDLIGVLGFKELSKSAQNKIEEKINKYLEKHGYSPIKFFYQKFDSEYDMIFSFFNKYIQKMPLITGWNVIEFDWKFLINRAKRLEIDPGVASMTGKLIGRDNLPVHRVIVDYMELYKKWDRVIFKENNSLNYVATAATGMGKIKYTGSLQELYENDFFTYVFYGAIDPILVKLIDKEISTIDVYFALSTISKTPLYKVFSPIAMTENVLVREYLKRNIVVPMRSTKPQKKQYEGAFVFPPKPDLYEWVGSWDFASLYPSIMRQWNMSPESFIKKLENSFEVSEEKYKNKIRSSSNAIFENSYDSAYRTILSNFYARRKKVKTQKKSVDKEIEKLEKLKKSLIS